MNSDNPNNLHADDETTYINLIEFDDSEENYEQTEQELKSALALQEKSLGPDHPDVAMAVCRLAIFYTFSEQYEKAEPLYKRSLANLEKALGPDHPSVDIVLVYFVSFYIDQELYSLAETLLKRALENTEKLHGLDNPLVAACLSNLANVYSEQELYTLAEPLLERALRINEKAAGTNNTDSEENADNLAENIDNLVEVYSAQGKDELAKALISRRLPAIKNENRISKNKTGNGIFFYILIIFFAIAMCVEFSLIYMKQKSQSEGDKLIDSLTSPEVKKENAERQEMIRKHPLMSFEQAKEFENKNKQVNENFYKEWAALADQPGMARAKSNPDKNFAFPATSVNTKSSEWLKALAVKDQSAAENVAATYLMFNSINTKIISNYCTKQGVDMTIWSKVFQANHKKEMNKVEAIFGGKDSMTTLLMYMETTDSVLKPTLESELNKVAELNGLKNAKEACSLIADHGARLADKLHFSPTVSPDQSIQ